MNIDKAIAILYSILLFVKPGDPPDEHDAISLGIEALKWVKDWRTIIHDSGDYRLPGETD